jgi:salicylate hydroxylase
VGGGIGGLSTALALADDGWQVEIFEQEDHVGAIGYGIQLGPNVFPVLQRIGVAQNVLAQSHQPDAIVMLDALDGREIARIPTQRSFLARFRYPYLVIHRADLHQILVNACGQFSNIALRAGAKVLRYQEEPDRVRVFLEDGSVHEGLCLIGADGLRSVIRAQLRDDGDPRPIGYVAHRTIIPMEDAPAGVRRDEVVMWAGPGFHIVQYPLRQGTILNLVAVFKTDTFSEKLDVEQYRHEVLRTYSAGCSVVAEIIAKLDLGRRWVISDRDPITRWSSGRVSLLGDAAHPTLQSYAQGAGMAFEDAICLADCFTAAQGRFDEAFERFRTARCVRTARVQLQSRTLWEDFHIGGIGRDVRNAVYREHDETSLFKCLAWLYDGFPAKSHDSRLSA